MSTNSYIKVLCTPERRAHIEGKAKKLGWSLSQVLAALVDADAAKAKRGAK